MVGNAAVVDFACFSLNSEMLENSVFLNWKGFSTDNNIHELTCGAQMSMKNKLTTEKISKNNILWNFATVIN